MKSLLQALALVGALGAGGSALFGAATPAQQRAWSGRASAGRHGAQGEMGRGLGPWRAAELAGKGRVVDGRGLVKAVVNAGRDHGGHRHR